MKLSKQVAWLNKKTLTAIPTTFEIVDTKEQDNNGKSDIQITLKLGDKLVKSSVFGQSLNKLIDLYGDETEKWKGKKINIHVELNVTSGKDIIVLS